MDNGFAFRFKEARLGTTIGCDNEQKKNCRQVSTFLRVTSNKCGDLSSQFDKINEKDIPFLERLFDLPPHIRDTPQQKMLINNHTDANKGKIKRYLYPEEIFGFCKGFKNVTKNLGFRLLFKTDDSQDILYTSVEDDIKVTIISLYLYIPNLIPSVETQLVFIEGIQNNDKIPYDEFFTERRLISDLLIQHHIGSTQPANSPKYLNFAHQTKLD